MNTSTILNRISYHAVYDESILNALKYARGNGFSGVQVAVESPHLSFERLSERDCEDIARYMQLNDLRLSIHAPDESVSLFEFSEYLVNGTFDYYSALFSFAEKVGCRLITFHLGSTSAFATDTTPRLRIPEVDTLLYRDALARNLSRLIELADGRFTLCVENYNMDQTALDAIQPYIDFGQIFLCWDLAKTFNRDGSRDDAVEDYFWRNLSHIRQVHLHDRVIGAGAHRVIGTGALDFMHYLSRLSDADVMDYCIEVRPREEALVSLKNLKNLLIPGL